ncbi:hypothetical protein D9615_006176 [Tricholomella constricta]|uniref:Uncharacterized protein n=1 Tax=Tricholomella constricta TaxID=117010 RepID=A0A8H5HBL2_9AGAR|nr:hypothetical protein D9615_006176 [Tricholomella constricta]
MLLTRLMTSLLLSSSVIACSNRLLPRTQIHSLFRRSNNLHHANSHAPVRRMTTTPQPVAPLVGTLRYPRDALLTLARQIVRDYEKDTTAKLHATKDDDLEGELSDNLGAIWLTRTKIDPAKWHEELEKRSPGSKASPAEIKQFERESEQCLLDLGAMRYSNQWVMEEAIKRRKAVRGKAPPTDAAWKKEDALLDLLFFFSRESHQGLFQAAGAK